jgi:hypothetical protein
MYGMSPSTPWSRAWTTFRDLSAAAAFASRMNRAWASSRLQEVGVSSLIASGVPRARCWARQTQPIPPRPISSRSS